MALTSLTESSGVSHDISGGRNVWKLWNAAQIIVYNTQPPAQASAVGREGWNKNFFKFMNSFNLFQTEPSQKQFSLMSDAHHWTIKSPVFLLKHGSHTIWLVFVDVLKMIFSGGKQTALSVWHSWLGYFQAAEVWMQTIHLETEWVPRISFFPLQFGWRGGQ